MLRILWTGRKKGGLDRGRKKAAPTPSPPFSCPAPKIKRAYYVQRWGSPRAWGAACCPQTPGGLACSAGARSMRGGAESGVAESTLRWNAAYFNINRRRGVTVRGLVGAWAWWARGADSARLQVDSARLKVDSA